MKESYGEGLANHTSLESCGDYSNMKDPRKSDNNIVPEKPANNGSKISAEQVEGRALTKGSIMTTAPQSAHRGGEWQ